MDKDKFKFFCDKCNYGTDIKYSLLQHNETILHKTGERGKEFIKEKEIYKCNICDYESNNKNNYLTHKLNNHSTKEEREKEFTYYCKFCDFGVFTESSMKTHNESIRHKRLSKTK
jgi:hypothetical protein